MTWVRLAAVSTVVLSATVAVAQTSVVVGPGNQSGVSGDVVQFTFSIAGPSAAQVSSAAFGLAWDPVNAPIEPVCTGSTCRHGDRADCAMADDLRATHQALTDVVSDVAPPFVPYVSVFFLDVTEPFAAIGRAGQYMTCNFRIRPGTAAGVYPLDCIHTPPPSSTNPRSNELDTVCLNGELTVMRAPTPTVMPTPTPCGSPPSSGDCNGDGQVTIDELLRAVNIALEVQPLSACPSFDVNGDRRVTVDEILRGVNLALGTCPPTPGVRRQR